MLLQLLPSPSSITSKTQTLDRDLNRFEKSVTTEGQREGRTEEGREGEASDRHLVVVLLAGEWSTAAFQRAENGARRRIWLLPTRIRPSRHHIRCYLDRCSTPPQRLRCGVR
jgi:hypothetical protein